MTRQHPIWKEVAQIIADRVAVEGYGFLIGWVELLELLEHEKPEAETTYEEHSKYCLVKMEKIESLKAELLYQHNIAIKSEYKEGYIIMEPDDQVNEGYHRHYKKARKQIRKGLQILLNVDEDGLSATGQKVRDRNVSKAVFIMKAMNKRSIGHQKLLNKKD